MVTSTVIIGAFFALIAGVDWFRVCNDRTYRQRTQILSAAFSDISGRHRDVLREYEQVSYDRHLLTLFFVKDWRKLYGPKTAIALGERT